MNKIFILLTACLFFASAGCSTTSYSVSVNSRVGDPEYQSQTLKYVIIPANNKVAADSLEFKEFSAYVAKVLQQRGYKVTSRIDEADLALFLNYAISDPKTETVSYSQPIFGQTGVQSSSTYGTYNPTSGSYSGTTYYTPTYGVTGYVPVTETYTHYTRLMLLDVLSLQKTDAAPKLGAPAWRVSVASIGSSGDLRKVFPVLVFASKDYIGVDSKKTVTFSIKENDKNLAAFTGEKDVD